MNPEWLLLCISVCTAGFWLLKSSSRGRIRWILASALLTIGVLLAALWGNQIRRKTHADEALLKSVPREGRPDGYVSSDKCQSCHPDQYASWHGTFHRTMTQLAAPDTVLGQFDNVTLQTRGKMYRLERRGTEFWAELEDPEWMSKSQPSNTAQISTSAAAPRVWRRVGLLTGSHHMQVYWIPSQNGNMQMVFPFAWLIEDQRWAPLQDTFLRDPDAAPSPHIWNVNCINCHSTGGQPRPNHQTRTLETRVGELGIACEACHGPAHAHVTENQSPWNRYGIHWRSKGDETIVNPERHQADVSSQICGQCHSIRWIPDKNDWHQNGFRYRPGGQLAKTEPVVRPTQLESQPWLTAPLKQNPTFLEDRFWPDGMVRVSGREYNGLIESPCHQKGELSCLSCHSMHQSKPNDQLAHGMDRNQACLQCHRMTNIESHTRHRAGSSGSECYNCHMPHTTYGLLKAIRSHHIDSPAVKTSLATGRPNACNLCHLDKSLGWTAKYLTEWYGQSSVTLNSDEESVSAALLSLLKGDAGQRALAAWSMGWEPAQEASGKKWIAPFLAPLLEDPYSAVRYIAYRSLRKALPESKELDFDFTGPREQQARAHERAIQIWKNAQSVGLDRTGTNILIEATGALQQDVIDRLLKQRNNRSMDLQE